jgi:hypothetical protein
MWNLKLFLQTFNAAKMSWSTVNLNSKCKVLSTRKRAFSGKSIGLWTYWSTVVIQVQRELAYMSAKCTEAYNYDNKIAIRLIGLHYTTRVLRQLCKLSPNKLSARSWRDQRLINTHYKQFNNSASARSIALDTRQKLSSMIGLTFRCFRDLG